MKNLFCILFIFICSVSFGQHGTRDQSPSKWVSYNGHRIKILTSDIPVSPADPTPPTPTPSYSLDSLNIIGIGNSIYNEDGEVFGLLDAKAGYSVTNLAVSGDRIAGQEALWDALVISSPSVIAAARLIIVGIGINDIANDSYDVNDMEDDYQAFIDNIRADINDSCKIIAATLTPARSNAFMTEQDYAEWLVFNAWMIASLTDVDYLVTDNTSDLNDGYGNLATVYNTPSTDGIHPNGPGQWIMVENFIEGIGELDLFPKKVYFINNFNRTPNSEYTETMIEEDYTTNGFVDVTNNLSIKIVDGDTVENSFYEKDHMGVCCVNDDYTFPYRGTGVNMSYYYNSDYSGHKVLAKSWWERLDGADDDGADFDIGRAGWVEMKQPGMRAGGSQYEAAVVRMLMNGDWSNDDHYYLRWYIQYEDESDEPISRSKCLQVQLTGDTLRVVPGTWFHLTMVLVMNDEGEDNGTLAVYKDGVLAASYGGHEFQVDNDLYWDRIEDCTFIGGADDENMTPDHDQNLQIDDEILWDVSGQLPNPHDITTFPTNLVHPAVCNTTKHE